MHGRPQSLEAAARWCANNDLNYDEALNWINSATDPRLGGRNNFAALSVKAKLLQKSGRDKESAALMEAAIEAASVQELHNYGRQLIAENKPDEAFKVFEKNYRKHKGAWPTNVGMMRAYAARGNYQKAAQHAKAAIPQATDEQTKQYLEAALNNLQAGKPL